MKYTELFRRTCYTDVFSNKILYVSRNSIVYPVMYEANNRSQYQLDTPRTCMNVYKFIIKSTIPVYTHITTGDEYMFVDIELHDVYIGFFAKISDVILYEL